MEKFKQWEASTGFIVLTGMVLILLLSSAYQAWQFHPLTGLITTLVLIGASLEIFYEGKWLIQQIKSNTLERSTHRFLEFSAVFFGGVITYFISINLGLGAVIASSLVAILAHMIVPDYGVPAYCGSFVGMTSNALLFNPLEVALASVVAGLVFVITSNLFSGFGGKLGTIALIGAAVTGAGLQRQFLFTPISDMTTNGFIILIAVIATPLTFYLNCEKGNGPVLASGVVGLLGGLILPSIFPVHGNTLAVVAICASFTGMSNEERCPAYWHIIIAGFFTGVIFIFSTPLLGGAGGKLGTIAFASVLSIYGFTQTFKSFYGRDSRYETE